MKAEDISNPQGSSNNDFSVIESGLASHSVHHQSDGTKTEEIDIKVADIVNTENDPTETQEEGIRDWSSDMEISLETDQVICVEDNLNLQLHAATVITDDQEEQDTLTSRLHVCHQLQTESHLHHSVMSANARSGVKRARMAFDDQQPSVHVIYNSITRTSKKRLQELLRQWSEWQAEDCSSNEDPNEVESGEETYFPALRVGTEKYSAVSFCIDSQVSREKQKGFLPPESNSIPLYDRGSALCLTSEDGSNNLSVSLEMIDNATRCFNCGSYNHSLKECPKPRDNNAVNKARNQYMAKKKQRGGSCHSIRYYQKSQGGKYDDLKPGVLSDETRKLLGLTEFDPPPWLNRMRELGYPPGYLAPEEEDEPSGIIIFADEESEEKEDTEVELTHFQEKIKKTAEFPGINASIPAAADGTRWAFRSGAQPQQASNNHKHDGHGSSADDEGLSSPVLSCYPPRSWHFPSRRDHATSPVPISISGRSFRDYVERPPGVSQGFSSVMSYPPRYGTVDASGMHYHTPSYHVPGSRSPVLGRSLSWGWGKPLGWVAGDDDVPPGIGAHDGQLKGYGYYGR